MPVLTESPIISPSDFATATEKWLDVVNNAGSNPLTAYFTDSHGQRIAGLNLAGDNLASLVSAPGAQRIKTRFMLVPDGGGNLHFSLALFATTAAANSADDVILSAYYVTDSYWDANLAQMGAVEPVPDSLAESWIAGWETASAVTAAQFKSTNGQTLEGYNFGIEDFVQPLMDAQSISNVELRIGFGLRSYYAPTDKNTPTQTFGLVLRLYSNGQPVSDAPFFDMATPCPPGN